MKRAMALARKIEIPALEESASPAYLVEALYELSLEIPAISLYFQDFPLKRGSKTIVCTNIPGARQITIFENGPIHICGEYNEITFAISSGRYPKLSYQAVLIYVERSAREAAAVDALYPFIPSRNVIFGSSHPLKKPMQATV